jgi:hypothetical protein
MAYVNRRRAGIVAGSAVLWTIAVGLSGCSRDAQAMTPQQLQQQYGITDAYAGQLSTPDGTVRGTFVPMRMPDGHMGELVIPPGRNATPYFRDEGGVHLIALQPDATREQLVAAPRVVSRRAAAPHEQTRSWQKELLIIGGTAGAGAGVGALTGGKKGAGIGAAAGGAGGLIYDLMTRKKP